MSTVSVRFHTKALQYERGQTVHGLTRGPILDGLIRRGHVEVLSETPDVPVAPAPEPPSEPEPAATADETPADPAPEPKPRGGRKRTDDGN